MAYAAIWDMDGVLVDTGRAHYQSWVETLAKRSVSLSYQQFSSTFGMNNTSILKLWLGAGTPQSVIDQVGDEKEAIFRRLVVAEGIQPLPGVRALLEGLQKAGFHQAVASSAPQANIDVLLDTTRLRPFFDAVVSAARLPGKPDPAVYLEAAARLGVTPAGCVVVEDAVAGVEGARRAGMRCIAVTTTNPAASLAAAGLVVDSLEKISAETFSRLLLVE
jgi:beta-phosphoglucomutase